VAEAHRSIRSILVPIDLSAQSTEVYQWALALAPREDTRLVLVHVLDIGQFVRDALPPGIDEDAITARMRAAAGDELASLGDRDNAPFDAETHVLTGHPATRIVEYASEHGFDLIVIGSTGRGMVSGLLGGTVDKVLRRAPCPVFMVPLGAGS
jgi:nucleotide-binding universal stress UspA family protein